jgi:hypothetical protein
VPGALGIKYTTNGHILIVEAPPTGFYLLIYIDPYPVLDDGMDEILLVQIEAVPLEFEM